MSDRRIHRVRIGRVTAKRIEFRPMVTDHAIVRYMERVFDLGPEIAELRREIAKEAQIAVLERHSYAEAASVYEGAKPHILVLQGQYVKTVLDAAKPRMPLPCADRR